MAKIVRMMRGIFSVNFGLDPFSKWVGRRGCLVGKNARRLTIATAGWKPLPNLSFGDMAFPNAEDGKNGYGCRFCCGK